MKKVFAFFKNQSVLMFLLFVAMAMFGVTDVSSMTATGTVVDGIDGAGKHISGDVLATDVIKTNSPDLILTDIDDRVTKISPYKNPIDQVGRLAGRQMKATGMEYKHYSIDIAPISDVVSAAYTESGSSATANLSVTNPDLFNISDTVTFGGVKGYDKAGTTITNQDLMCYVIGKTSDNPAKIYVQPVNGKLVGAKITVPTIPLGTECFLLSTAAMEGDIRSYSNSALPTPETGFLQIYKMEVGETTLAQMTNKEVKWELDDQIEIGVSKLRAGIERSSLIGVKGKTAIPGSKYAVYTTGGILWDIEKEFELPENPTDKDLIKFHKYIFSGQSGSNRKIMLMGSEFNEAISCIPGVMKQMDAKATELHWGLQWSMITTNFGTTAALPYDMLDLLGRSNECIIIDPEYLDKWTLLPFGSKDLDLKSAGLFDGDVNVTTEISSYCIRYKNAHCKGKIVKAIKVTGISTSAATKALAIGATYDFAATNTIAPSDATNKTVTYVSSQPTKASVDASGVVTGLAAATVVISAVTADGSYSAVCTVTVS